MSYGLSLFIFHRDVRLHDNTALIAALQQSTLVLPVFIATPEQLERNEYKGSSAVQFLVESLQDLHTELQKLGSRLYLFSGSTDDVVRNLLSTLPIEAVFSNADYTPFARKRDDELRVLCAEHSIPMHVHHDALLTVPGSIRSGSGTPYTVFTPFKRTASMVPVALPVACKHTNYYTLPVAGEVHDWGTIFIYEHNTQIATSGGRSKAIPLLRALENANNYTERRNLPALDCTSHLSAHHKFGTVSVRETYHTVRALFGEQHTLISELYWRDFFTHVGYEFPHVFTGPFKKQYNSLQWSTNMEHLQAWQEGRTGYPIVDAGMRELNTTGFMHNRVRMITASFLVKHLHINWRTGEKYFATKLIDYDPAVNNGNWQWVASTGCGAQPYFRIFNPWLQQKKFDPECEYIKNHIPELQLCTAKEIHSVQSEQESLFTTYPAPIVDHSMATARTKALYAAVR